MRDIVHPEDVPTFGDGTRAGLAGTSLEFVFRIVTSRGVVKHLRGVAHRVEQIADSAGVRRRDSGHDGQQGR